MSQQTSSVGLLLDPDEDADAKRGIKHASSVIKGLSIKTAEEDGDGDAEALQRALDFSNAAQDSKVAPDGSGAPGKQHMERHVAAAHAHMTVPPHPAQKPSKVSWKTTIYVLCNDPSSCKSGLFLNGLLTSTILASVLAFVMETLEQRRYPWNMDKEGYDILERIFVVLFTLEPVVILAEDFSRLDALLFTAMAWIFIPAHCFALP